MKFFEGYIGQKAVVGKMAAVCNAVVEGRDLPFQPFAALGHAGLGKTYLGELFARELSKASGNEFRHIEISSAVSLPQFVGIWADHCEGKKVFISIDEAHALNKKMMNFLKPMLETNRQVKEIKYGDLPLTSNPYEQQWFFMTNEEPKDSALWGATGRCASLVFQPYTMAEVKALMRQKAQRWATKMKLEDSAIDYLATRVMPNARAISQLVESDCLLEGGTVTEKTAKEICKREGYFPLGLRDADIKIMQFVAKDDKGRQVNEIASAANGLDARTVSDKLAWLSSFGFIFTHSGKKKLAPMGLKYLVDLKASIDESKKRKATVRPVERTIAEVDASRALTTLQGEEMTIGG